MIHQLSGGMQQRVGLARALVNNPKLLLMDEPYSALDPLIRKEMQDELLEFEDNSNRTIIFITHDMNEAFRLGDRIALMKDGEIVQIGTPLDFFHKPKNDYVKSFISDVDKTRTLKVRNVMRSIKHTTKEKALVKDVLSLMNKKDIESFYVTDKDNKLIGAILKEDIIKSKDKTIDNIIDNKIYKKVHRNEYLIDVLPNIKEFGYDMPVTDSNNRLRGVIGYEDVINALAW